MPTTATPHCPKCNGKPTAGQRKLTLRERNGLKGQLFDRVSTNFETAYRCTVCGAVYSFHDGFSTFLGYLPKQP